MNRQYPFADVLKLQADLEAFAHELGGERRALLFNASQALRQQSMLIAHVRQVVSPEGEQ